MKSHIFVLFFLVYFLELAVAYYAPPYYQSRESKEKALFLTGLIEKGKVVEAKQQALVNHPEINLKSYSGYITVNKHYQSNSFFWFFPSQTNPADDPVILWLNGGPGVSVMFAIFDYNGPFVVSQNQTLKLREHSFTTNHSVIYVDSPLGTGYSFTKIDAGYSRSLKEVTRDIMNFLEQFYALFPEFRKNDFFIGGDSYAGKYAVTASKVITEYNRELNNINRKIRLRGFMIGNGLIDTAIQANQADYLHSVGLIDFNAQDQMLEMEQRLHSLYYSNYSVREAKYLSGKEAERQYRDLYTSKTDLISNLTGYTDFANILRVNQLTEIISFFNWVQRDDVRKAIHVGNSNFTASFTRAKDLLPRDPYASVKKELEELLEQYRVLIYHGQLDLEFPYPRTIDMIRSFKWSGAEEYKKIPRKIWRVKGEVAGYWKSVRNFNEVIVREAGHVATLDQLPWVNDIMTKFTRGKSP